MKPTAYVANFRAMAIAVHSRTNMTAMVWAPNTGDGYPYGTTRQSISNPADFDLLDTNKNGVLDKEGDDPYGAYWPGKEYVDWVGLSTYW
jgi:hypothetical protein